MSDPPDRSPGGRPGAVTITSLDAVLARIDRLRSPGACAVFDWDHTALYGDLGETVLQHLLTPALRLSPDALLRHLPRFPASLVLDGRALALADLRADIGRAYRALGRGCDADAGRAFRVGMTGLYRALCATPGFGERRAFPWLAGLLGGYRPTELHGLALEVFAREQRVPLRRLRLTMPEGYRCAGLRVTIAQGLRIVPVVRRLIHQLRRRGVAVFVVSASEEHLVRAIAGPDGPGYDIDPARVFGQRLHNVQGRLVRHPAPGWPVPCFEGKVAAIRQVLPRAPLLVAGDSLNDLAMLTSFDDTAVRLVVQAGERDTGLVEAVSASGRACSVLSARPARGLRMSRAF